MSTNHKLSLQIRVEPGVSLLFLISYLIRYELIKNGANM